MNKSDVDYIATHFRRGEQPTRVGAVRILGRGESGEFEDRDLVDREGVVELLRAGEDIFVWDYEAEGLGDAIELVDVQGAQFLRVDGEELGADNLGGLPEV